MNKYYASSIIMLSLFIILSFIVSQVDQNNLINFGDTALLLTINNDQTSVINTLMIFFSQYGREVVWSVVILLFFTFGGANGRKIVMIVLLTIIVVALVGSISKEIIQRPRPSISELKLLIPSESDYSFPSGHTMIVTSCSAVVIGLFRDSLRRKIISIGLVTEAALVSFSRIYVGVHYPLDVLGGVLLGLGIAFIFIGSRKRIEIILQEKTKRFIT
ncbi:MAG TPA: phosphatase PAP2 family protein [Nitrososphaerales archaeon]